MNLQRVVHLLLDARADALSSAGIKLVFRGIEPIAPGTGTAEARISIYGEGQLIDSLEFLVTRNGEAAVTPDEVEAWLTEQDDRLIADHPWNGGWEEV